MIGAGAPKPRPSIRKGVVAMETLQLVAVILLLVTVLVILGA